MNNVPTTREAEDACIHAHLTRLSLVAPADHDPDDAFPLPESMRRKATPAVTIREDDDGVWLYVKSPGGRGVAINLSLMEGEIVRDAFLGWALSRLEMNAKTTSYLVPPTWKDQPKESLTEQEIYRAYAALTNGVGEVPYAKKDLLEMEPGETDFCGYNIYVADEQEFAHVHPISDPAGYEKEIVWAICHAGLAIKQIHDDLQAALDILHDLDDALCLGDRVYDVREREGLGWDGPKVTQWGNAVDLATALLKKYGRHERKVPPWIAPSARE